MRSRSVNPAFLSRATSQRQGKSACDTPTVPHCSTIDRNYRQEFPTILSDDNPTYGKDWFDPPSKWYQDNIWAFFEDKNLVHLDMPPMNHTQTWGDEKDPETWRQTTRPTMPVHLYYVKKKG